MNGTKSLWRYFDHKHAPANLANSVLGRIDFCWQELAEGGTNVKQTGLRVEHGHRSLPGRHGALTAIGVEAV